MADKQKIDRMVEEIKTIRKSAAELKKLSGDIEAVRRNADRILASVKMLELNVSDAADLR